MKRIKRFGQLMVVLLLGGGFYILYQQLQAEKAVVSVNEEVDSTMDNPKEINGLLIVSPGEFKLGQDLVITINIVNASNMTVAIWRPASVDYVNIVTPEGHTVWTAPPGLLPSMQRYDANTGQTVTWTERVYGVDIKPGDYVVTATLNTSAGQMTLKSPVTKFAKSNDGKT